MPRKPTKAEEALQKPQTFQIGNEMVSKEEFTNRVNQLKGEAGDTQPGIPPFADKELKAKIQAETTPVTPGRTAEQFQVMQQKQQQVSEQPVDTAREIPIKQAVPAFQGKAGESITQSAGAAGIVSRIKAGGMATPEEIQRLGLNELDIEVIKSGEADINILGGIIESIPFVGRKGIGGVSLKALVGTTPSEKVKELQTVMTKTQDNIIKWTDMAKSNPAQASQYVSLIEKSEQKILRLESRIKLNTIQSPELQSNPDQIDSIMEDITNTKSTIQGKKKELELLGLR